MRSLFIPVIALALLAGEAQAEARYMPIENSYALGAVNNPQPLRIASMPRYRPERINMAEFREVTRMPVYREAYYRDVRMSMPRDIPMPRNFRIDMNPAGRTPR